LSDVINQQQHKTQLVTSDHVAILVALRKKSNLGGCEQEGPSV